MMGDTRTVTHAEWLAEATAKFGDDAMKWRFICPSCGHVASVQDWKDAGAPTSVVAFSCVGRYNGHMSRDAFKKDGGPCNYAGAGLFRINPVHVTMPDGEDIDVFEFAAGAA